jgi:hypothetical protein
MRPSETLFFSRSQSHGRPGASVYFASGARLTAMSDLWMRDEAQAIAERIARGFSRGS